MTTQVVAASTVPDAATDETRSLRLLALSGIRAVLARAESRIRGSAPLGRVVFAGGLIGVGAMAMALVTMAAASSDGGNVDPTVANAVTTGAAGPFMVAAMGFAAFLLAAGLLTLRTGVFARRTGIVAVVGAVALVTWTAAASISTYRSTLARAALAPA